MKPLFLAMPGNEGTTSKLAAALAGDVGTILMHSFPDGETYIRVKDNVKNRIVVLVCTLAHPNEKFLPLIFAADALQDLGARQVGLVAPYLSYMRQDRRFNPGEAISSRSFARLISGSVNWLVTVDPHLHRYRSLGEIYTIPSIAVHAGPALAQWIKKNVTTPFIIGPDSESRQWVAAVASSCGADFDVLQKTRLGDQSVSINASGFDIPPNACPVILDDIVSSGATLLKTLQLIRQRTASPAFAVAIHAFGDPILDATLRTMDAKLATSNTIPNPNACIDIEPLLADAIAKLIPESTNNCDC